MRSDKSHHNCFRKVLFPLYGQVNFVFLYRKPTFPRVDGGSSKAMCEKVKYACNILRQMHRGSGKKATKVVYKNKILESSQLPPISKVQNIIEKFESKIDMLLKESEIEFNNKGDQVNIAAVIEDGRRTNEGVSRALSFFSFVFIKTCEFLFTDCKTMETNNHNLGRHHMFRGKHRFGVIQYFMIEKYLYDAPTGEDTVVYIAEHKLGLNRPAFVVANEVLMEWLDR